MSISVGYPVLSLTGCNCRDLHMMAQHGSSIDDIILYLFIPIFILSRPEN